MIRTDAGAVGDNQNFFSVRSPASLARDLKPGSIVRVSVLGALSDGTFRIMVGDRVLVAASLSVASVGSTFTAKIRFEGDAVLLMPVADSLTGLFSETSSLASLGLPETPVSVFLVSFFTSIGMRLDPDLIRSLMKTAARFHGRELRAAEAAAVLAERGIAADDETVERMLALLEGRSHGSDSRNSGSSRSDSSDDNRDDPDRQFCAFVNQKKGQELHWTVMPFRRQFAGRTCSGSVRFLLDLNAQKTVETRVTFLDGQHCWDFSVTGKACSFTAEPGFSSVVFEEFVVYLHCLLEKSGIESISWHDPGKNPGSGIKSVDLEI